MSATIRIMCALMLTLSALASVPSVSAQSPALMPDTNLVIRGVEVTGLIRVDRASVRSKIYSQIGQNLEASRISEDIKRVYRMGFFEDVAAATKPAPDGGIILVFKLAERPTILEVGYEIRGDELDQEALAEVVNLKRYDILDEEAIERWAAAAADEDDGSHAAKLLKQSEAMLTWLREADDEDSDEDDE